MYIYLDLLGMSLDCCCCCCWCCVVHVHITLTFHSTYIMPVMPTCLCPNSICDFYVYFPM